MKAATAFRQGLDMDQFRAGAAVRRTIHSVMAQLINRPTNMFVLYISPEIFLLACGEPDGTLIAMALVLSELYRLLLLTGRHWLSGVNVVK